jgi:putative transposase
VFPYLLRHRTITRPNEVWEMDITYIPMERGFVYLAAVLDWASRRVLSWRVSITLDSAFCIAAVEEAIAKYGCPTIFNTDQGAQFTSAAFTGLRSITAFASAWMGRAAGATTSSSSDSGARSSTKRSIFTGTTRSPPPLRGIGRYITLYNTRRPHSSFADRTPDDAYFFPRPLEQAA